MAQFSDALITKLNRNGWDIRENFAERTQNGVMLHIHASGTWSAEADGKKIGWGQEPTAEFAYAEAVRMQNECGPNWLQNEREGAK